jgi:putative hydrolase
VIPTVDTIRSKFTSRRTSGNPVDQLLKRLLGLDAKLRQYKDGAAFVRRVVDQVGMEGFNRVWTGPNTLPTKNEIASPDAWVARLHG